MDDGSRGDLILGVELEWDASINPDKGREYRTKYPVVIAYDKNDTHGCNHIRHGNIVERVSIATEDFIKVGYDNTASPVEGDGIELYSDPAPIEQHREAWIPIFDIIKDKVSNSPTGNTSYGNPVSCGMHVHVSGLPSIESWGRVASFVFNKQNESLIRYVAGRYDEHYCKIPTPWSAGLVKFMCHSKNCKVWPGEKFSDHSPVSRMSDEAKEFIDKHDGFIMIDPPLTGATGATQVFLYDGNIRDYMDRCRMEGRLNLSARPQLISEQVFRNDMCCALANPRHDATRTKLNRRWGLNLNPTKGTGQIEFRLFKSPMDMETFNERLDFAHAVVVHCLEEAEGDFPEWVYHNRNMYPHLHSKLESIAKFRVGRVPVAASL